jgi:hypothetical protein
LGVTASTDEVDREVLAAIREAIRERYDEDPSMNDEDSGQRQADTRGRLDGDTVLRSTEHATWAEVDAEIGHVLDAVADGVVPRTLLPTGRIRADSCGNDPGALYSALG